MAQRPLKALEDVRRYLAHPIKSAEADEIDQAKGGRLAYIVSILIRAIEGGEGVSVTRHCLGNCETGKSPWSGRGNPDSGGSPRAPAF